MFFGLTNSLVMFQTMMNSLLRDLINMGKVLVYMDDIIIFTNNLDEHQKLVCQVLQILCKNKLYLKLKKCKFEKTRIEYLGLIILENSVEVDLDSNWKLEDGLIYFQNLLYVPPTNKLREKIIFAHHHKPMAGHLGRYKTQELIQQNYYRPLMQRLIGKYIDGCECCQQDKIK